MSEKEIIDAIEKIKSLIDDGWSIQMAKRKVVGTPRSRLGKSLMRSIAYVEFLNKHMEKQKRAFKLEKNIIKNLKPVQKPIQVITDEKIDQAFIYLQQYLDEGWSISIARKKACGFYGGKLSDIILRDRRYVHVLNKYMKKIGKNTQYEYRDGMARLRR